MQGHGGVEPLPADAEREAGEQFITRLTFGDKQPYILTVTPIYSNLESILHLTHMSDHPEGTEADTGQTPRTKAPTRPQIKPSRPH